MLNLFQDLRQNPYPGRGIVLGKSACGTFAVLAYFIMGRSEGSRNRVFVPDGTGLRTRAFDESKLPNPSLYVYAPVRVFDACTIVTNGDQTDTIYDHFASGKSFEEALQTRTFEPDPPSLTPRISGLCVFTGGDMHIKLSILKSLNCGAGVTRQFFLYDGVAPGEGWFIHTYKGDGNPLPSYEGEPKHVALDGGIGEFTDALWHALDPDNRVSLFVRYQHLTSGTFEDKVINKHLI